MCLHAIYVIIITRYFSVKWHVFLDTMLWIKFQTNEAMKEVVVKTQTSQHLLTFRCNFLPIFQKSAISVLTIIFYS